MGNLCPYFYAIDRNTVRSLGEFENAVEASAMYNSFAFYRVQKCEVTQCSFKIESELRNLGVRLPGRQNLEKANLRKF